MRFSITTWNINSVRLRIDIVAKFLKSARPDVLCLQETKCIDDAFPLKRFKRLQPLQNRCFQRHVGELPHRLKASRHLRRRRVIALPPQRLC